MITVVAAIVAAAMSPLLAWRQPVYIVAGFAGIVAMVLLLFQPLLATALLPGFSAGPGRRIHRWLGTGLLLSVIVHLVGLWITSPPDVIDALLFASPTAFSVWGVLAMWGVFLTSGLVLFRRRLKLNNHRWRFIHRLLGAAIVAGSILHAMLIDGAMETVSKFLLCLLVLFALIAALAGLKPKYR